MPRVKWIGEAKKPKKKPHNELAAVLRQYKLESGKTSEQVGAELGVTGAAVRAQLGKEPDKWQIGTLRRYCVAVGCPLEKALEAVK